MDLIYYTANGLNGFDSLGHYLRALLLVTNCVDYRVTPLSGCDANWLSESSTTPRLSDIVGKQDRDGGAAGALETQPGETNEIPLPGPAPAPRLPPRRRPRSTRWCLPRRRPPTTPTTPEADEDGDAGSTGEEALRTRCAPPDAAQLPDGGRGMRGRGVDARIEPRDGRRDHGPDRDPRRLPRLQRQPAACRSCRPTGSRPRSRTPTSSCRATRSGSAACASAWSRRSSRSSRRTARRPPASTSSSTPTSSRSRPTRP